MINTLSNRSGTANVNSPIMKTSIYIQQGTMIVKIPKAVSKTTSACEPIGHPQQQQRSHEPQLVKPRDATTRSQSGDRQTCPERQYTFNPEKQLNIKKLKDKQLYIKEWHELAHKQQSNIRSNEMWS